MKMLDKKIRTHRRSPSSSSTSSSSSSTSSSSTSSSSSSSSFNSRRDAGQSRKVGGGTSGKPESRSRKSHSFKHLSSTDRSKSKKTKSSSSSRKHGSSKGSFRKTNHPGRKDYKDFSLKDFNRGHAHKISHSPSRHHRRSGSSKKLLSPSHKRSLASPMAATRKPRHKHSTSPRDRLDFHKVIDHTINRDSSLGPSGSSRLRDPRIEERLKRSSPDAILRDRYREERDHFDDRRRDDPRRAEDRERGDPREKKIKERDGYKERDRNLILGRETDRDREIDERRGGRYGRDQEFMRDRSGRDLEEERDYYARVPGGLESRSSSCERRAYDDPYDRYGGDRERPRFEGGRGRFGEMGAHDRRPSTGEYSSLDEMGSLDDRRGRPPLPPSPMDSRFGEDRRKSGGPPDRSLHDPWGEERRSGGVGGSSAGASSIADRIQDKGDHYAHLPPHSLPPPHNRRGGMMHHDQWGEPGPSGRLYPPHGWEKHPMKKRRGGGSEWPEDYPHGGGGERGEWMEEGPDWGPDAGDRMMPPHPGALDKGWMPPHTRRFHPNWDDNDRPPPDWGGSVLKRLGARSPSVTTPHHSIPTGGLPRRNTPRKDSTLTEIETEKESPRAEKENVKAEGTQSNTSSPSKKPPTSQEGQTNAGPPKAGESSPTQPPAAQAAVASGDPPSSACLLEKDNFSDFSDGDDDILNQEVMEEIVPEKAPATAATDQEVKTPTREAPTYEEILEEEERMDLEEISDDEFEEERQAKFSVANALDIDWSTLKDPRPAPIPTQTSALKRFRPLHLLARLGVSTKYASPEILNNVMDACLKFELKLEKNSQREERRDETNLGAEGSSTPMETTSSVKEEKNNDQPEESNEENLKEASEELLEEGEIKKEKEPIPEILPVVAPGGVVRHLRQMSMSRSHLFSIGPHRRALCARQDLAIRRRLCNLPEQDLVSENAAYNKHLFKEAINLLKSC